MSASDQHKDMEELDEAIREGQVSPEQNTNTNSESGTATVSNVAGDEAAQTAPTAESSDELEKIVDDFIKEGGAFLDMLPESHAQSLLDDIHKQESAVSKLIYQHVADPAAAKIHVRSASDPTAASGGDVLEEAERLLKEDAEKEAKRQELERRVQEQAAELEALKKKLAEKKLVKVTERVDHDSGIKTEVIYEHLEISQMNEQEAKHLTLMAERARKTAEEAEKKAEKARREAAEEAFRFEAAKAEVRLEAFRMQQRLLKEKAAREERQASQQSTQQPKNPAVREGWVKIKRSGAVGGWDERFLRVHAQGLSMYLDDSGTGQCLNVIGLEHVERVARVSSGTLMEVIHSAGVLLLDCEKLADRERWVQAMEQTLGRFRTTYVAQPPQKRRAMQEIQKSEWDVAVEEKTRQELQRQRQTVLEAERRRDMAERDLDRARATHIQTDRELRLRLKYPDISSDFLGTMPPTQPRNSGGYGQNIAGMVALSEVEKAVVAAEELAKKEASRALKETTQAFQAKVQGLEKARAETEQELQVYKEMAFKDAERKAAAEARKNLSSRDKAREDANAFDAKMYKDGMLVVPDGYLFDDVPGLSNLPSPSGKVKRDNVTVFTDGPQAVILQGLNVAAFSTNDRTEDTERAPKMGPAEAERSYH